jgi:H+/Cl- antiporter ClcA
MGLTVHISAAIMFSLGRFGNFPLHLMDRGLILASGAAGIATTFNTPLIGILFAIEKMARSFEEHNSGTLLTAVFTAGITVVAIQGNHVYFGSTGTSMARSSTLTPILACGVTGERLDGLFSQSLIWTARRLARLATRRPIVLAASCGIEIVIIGLLTGGLTFGTGYEEVRQVITGEGKLSLSYPFLRMTAVPTGTVVILRMVGYFTGVVQTPITALG